ncbi:hypothetical protein BJY04DRAFT_25265 [Aspergillus karnatakaensis]|uniref:uncharacterized protein n=1 Tax=Aspergillus karnatakaensis TaxID=1810916 RepID=UPI003CCD446B
MTTPPNPDHPQTPTPTEPTTTTPNREADFKRFKDNAAIAFLITSPILLAIPPRRLNPSAIFHISAFTISLNHVTANYTGKSILDRLSDRIISRSTHNPAPSFLATGETAGLPTEKAREIHAKIREAREARIKDENLGREEREKLLARQEHERGVVERVWMGNETGGWKERRLREEQKALDEGKGYGDLIKEHIWDVWTWGESRKEEREDDEEE